MKLFQLIVVGMVILGIAALVGCTQEDKARETEEQNMALVRHVHAEMIKGNVSVMDEALAPDYVRHCQAMPPEFQELHDTEQFKTFLEEFIVGVSDCRDTIDVIFAEGDKVAYVSTMTATHSGTMNGIPATGKTFTLVSIIIQRFENGKIAETWISWDNVAMLAQLGLFPPPSPESKP